MYTIRDDTPRGQETFKDCHLSARVLFNRLRKGSRHPITAYSNKSRWGRK